MNPFECSDTNFYELSLKPCGQPSVRFWHCSGTLFGRCKDHSSDDNEVVQRIGTQSWSYQELTFEEVLIAQVMVV